MSRPRSVEDDAVVILLDEDGQAVGTAPKATVHRAWTPRHLAFSAYLFDPEGALLVTRRSLRKATFPGVWTNTVCGHPGPGESLPAAARRRALAELGTTVQTLRLVLPEFGYRATMDGVMENELCPVYTGTLANRGLATDPDEVDDVEWVPWPAFASSALDGSRPLSPWCVEQVRALLDLGPTPQDWPEADPARLPPGGRPSPAFGGGTP